MCCDGGCTEVDSDSQNCGGCGVVCTNGLGCTNGYCNAVLSCDQFITWFELGSNIYNCVGDAAPWGGMCCGTSCVGYSDDLNCGECGWACPSGSHCSLAGGCEFPDGGEANGCDAGPCPPGTTCADGECIRTDCPADSRGFHCAFDAGNSVINGNCCGSTCVDLSSDLRNCGACGIACATGASCSVRCQPYCVNSSECPAGWICDGEACRDPGCDGHPQGAPCIFGVSPYDGPAGYCCGGTCVDDWQDPNNCGACGNACSSGICYQANCLDTRPSSNCSVSCGPGTLCVAGQCRDGSCSPDFNASGLACAAEDGTVGVCCYGGGCAHLIDDPQNCGACGAHCPAGQTCANGTCSGSPACGLGHIGQYCDLDAGPSFLCCPGLGCIDTSGDPANCGACGWQCDPGTMCVTGLCTT
jgi:hypothetical protein